MVALRWRWMLACALSVALVTGAELATRSKQQDPQQEPVETNAQQSTENEKQPEQAHQVVNLDIDPNGQIVHDLDTHAEAVDLTTNGVMDEDVMKLLNDATEVVMRGSVEELFAHLLDGYRLPSDEQEDPELGFADEEAQHELLEEPEPSDEFLDIEEDIFADGFTDEHVQALELLVERDQDIYAMEKLANMDLFEPAPGSVDFKRAMTYLQVAVDAGIPSAISTLAMLHLIDFGMDQPLKFNDARHHEADLALYQLSLKDDFVGSLAMGYRILTGKRSGLSGNTCEDALYYYHLCAETNVHTIIEERGEKSVDIVRLSREWMATKAFNEPAIAAEEAAQEFEYLRGVAANPGDEQWVEATHRLGEMYFFGDPLAGVPQDHGQAAQHFQEAANAGDALAQANYGILLANGFGVPQDHQAALNYFEQAAAQGIGFAMHGLGAMYLSGDGVPRNETKAVLYFEKAVELGYMDAHTYLGSCYLNGNGVAINATKAFEHFTLAASGASSSQAFFNLGIMLFRGIGTTQSCDKALHNFRMVALHPELLSDLPFSLTKGYACYQKGDYLRSFLHYRLVAEFGDEDAQANAAFLLEHFGDSDIFPIGTEDTKPLSFWLGHAKHALKEAFGLYQQASHLNDSESVRKMGDCFHEPWAEVCQQNHSRALEHYARATELGDAEAGYTAGVMYSTADGVERDLVAARVRIHVCYVSCECRSNSE